MRMDIYQLLHTSKLSLIETKDNKWYLRLLCNVEQKIYEERYPLDDVKNYRSLDGDDKDKYHEFVKHYIGLRILEKINTEKRKEK